jgi:hypothetical protein
MLIHKIQIHTVYILRKMSSFTTAETNEIFKNLKAKLPTPFEYEALELEEVLDSYSNENRPLFLTYTESHGVVIIASAIKHVFPSNKSQWFVGVVSPKTIAGIYAIRVENAPHPSLTFKLSDEIRVANLDFPDIVTRDEIRTYSFAPFPNKLLAFMEQTEFVNAIDPKALAIKINGSDLPEVPSRRLLDFLFQCHAVISGAKILRLATPSVRGRESWTNLKSKTLDTSDNQNQHSPIDMDGTTASVQDQQHGPHPTTGQEAVDSDQESTVIHHAQHVTLDSSGDDSDSAESPIPPKRFKSYHNAADIGPWIRELQTLNTTMANHFLNVAATPQGSHILSLEDKSSWFKKAPETIREWLINLRAGPAMKIPTELSPEMDSIMKQTSSKQQADIQIPVIISKAMNVRQFDCMATGQDYENWFKHGEFKQPKMVAKFSDAFGMNLHSLGPKNPINKPITVTSNNGLKHKIFIPSHFVELEDAASNLLAIVSMIAGAGNTSFATMALQELLEFYRSFKADIKQMCEIRGNLLQDIQMQLGNEWNAFLIKASIAPPSSGPDFACVTNQIEKGKLPLPFLTESFSVPSQDYGRQNDRKPKDKTGKPPGNALVNQSPQLRMEGSTDAERFENFKRDFLRRGAIKDLNLPKVDDNGRSSQTGKYMCMHFHIKHKCARVGCNLFHGKLSDDVISAVLAKTASKNLKVTKM